MKKRYALLSVFDKESIVALGRGLERLGYSIISTGGTARALQEAGVSCEDIESFTGQKELFAGRVKTLHPRVHAGILARRNKPEDVQEIEKEDLIPIDLVAVNLYPFQEKIDQGVGLEEALENIDIGGPTLIRAAAKNFPHVLVLVDPQDYEKVLTALEEGEVSREFRCKLASKAFHHTAAYENNIQEFFQRVENKLAAYEDILEEPERSVDEMVDSLQKSSTSEDGFPARISLEANKLMDLRYGENPHQEAALYSRGSKEPGTIVGSELISGKPLSYNNLLDAEAALNIVLDFNFPTCSVIKHNNPSGVGSAQDLLSAMEKALYSDLQSAYGSIIACNGTVEEEHARFIVGNIPFVEVIIAPSFKKEALTILTGRWQNLRLLRTGPLPEKLKAEWELRSLRGGFLLQDGDQIATDVAAFKVVTDRQPEDDELADLVFTWQVAKHVKSNAIVLGSKKGTVGIGAGQMSRVDAARMAVMKAGRRAQGAVMASDAMIPFPDALEVCHEAGVRAVIQPGGSKGDDRVIEMANRANLAMVFTSVRHFRH